jgi:hypothetical protein
LTAAAAVTVSAASSVSAVVATYSGSSPRTVAARGLDLGGGLLHGCDPLCLLGADALDPGDQLAKSDQVVGGDGLRNMASNVLIALVAPAESPRRRMGNLA